MPYTHVANEQIGVQAGVHERKRAKKTTLRVELIHIYPFILPTVRPIPRPSIPKTVFRRWISVTKGLTRSDGCVSPITASALGFYRANERILGKTSSRATEQASEEAASAYSFEYFPFFHVCVRDKKTNCISMQLGASLQFYQESTQRIIATASTTN